ncbi:PHD finger protein 3 isoform X2 [Centruroides vittatus]|uniref:PHD finger protein 3 isoform X2 n=1 Tax=Centruroides vittatus TaxID=120091 RepID=UPI00350F0D00
MECEENPFLAMSQDQIQKIDAVLQSEQAKVLLQESSHSVKLFEGTPEKESLDMPATNEEQLPILDDGLRDLANVFENDGNQVLFSESNEVDIGLSTELLPEDLNLQAMELDVILKDHCYTSFPEDLLKNIQNKFSQSESSSDKTDSPVKKGTQVKPTSPSLRRSQRQLDKIQREQVEKIKAENAELQRREKEEMERRKSQNGNVQQKENQSSNGDSNSNINEEVQEKINDVSPEKLSAEIIIVSGKEKASARKSIQQKKSHPLHSDDDEIKETDKSKAEESDSAILNAEMSEKIVSNEDELSNIETNIKNLQGKKTVRLKKKKRTSSESSSKSDIKEEKKCTEKISKRKLSKSHSVERSRKHSSDSENKVKEIKINEGEQTDLSEDKNKLKDDKLAKGMKKLKKLHNRRESSKSLVDEPALFSQPDVMVKRKTSTEESSIKKEKGVVDNADDKLNCLENEQSSSKVKEAVKDESVTEEIEEKTSEQIDEEIERHLALLEGSPLSDEFSDLNKIIKMTSKELINEESDKKDTNHIDLKLSNITNESNQKKEVESKPVLQIKEISKVKQLKDSNSEVKEPDKTKQIKESNSEVKEIIKNKQNKQSNNEIKEAVKIKQIKDSDSNVSNVKNEVVKDNLSNRKQKKNIDFHLEAKEKKHFTRYSIGKIKSNKYIKLLTGKGDADAENHTSDDDPERLWCICRQPYDERFMIQCDHCEDWFHGNCVGVTQQQGRQLEKSKKEWWCPRCIEGKNEESKQANVTEEKVAPPKVTSVKSVKISNKIESKVTSMIPQNISIVSAKSNSSVKKAVKDHSVEGNKAVSSEHIVVKHQKVIHSISRRDDEQKPEPVRLNVRNTLKGILLNRCNNANDIDISEDEIKKITNHIEEELYRSFKDTGIKYKAKYRSLMFNIKDPRNQGLFRKIVKGIITAHQLVKMTPEELASNELAKWRERESKHMLEMIKREQIEQATMTPIIKKTHKGEVEVDEDVKIPDQKQLKQMAEEINEPLPDTTDKHRSHLFDLNCKICTGKMAPPIEEMPLKKVRIAHAISKEFASGEEGTSPDNEAAVSRKTASKVEESNTDDSVDQEVSSTLRSPDSTVASYFISTSTQNNKTYPSVWRGFIAMQDVSKFVTTAYKVSGTTDYLEQYIPDSIQVCGRIVPDQVWDYLTKIKQSVNKEIIIIRFQPANDEERIAYGKFYSYLNSRKRYGVVGNCSRMIKDFYIIPLASHTPVPTVLMPFKGPGLDSSRPHLLLGVIVCHTTKPRVQSHTVKASKGPERSYTPPLETMPYNTEESVSSKHTPVSDEYEPSYTPPLEKLPKFECDDSTSQNKTWKDEDADKPYDPEDDDNFVTSISAAKPKESSSTSNESLALQTRLLIELTKKVEQQKQEIQKSLKMTNKTLMGTSQVLAKDESSIPSKKCKLDSDSERADSSMEIESEPVFQIPGLGDDWQLPVDTNTYDTNNATSSENSSNLDLPQKLHDILCRVKENMQKSSETSFLNSINNRPENDYLKVKPLTNEPSSSFSKIIQPDANKVSPQEMLNTKQEDPRLKTKSSDTSSPSTKSSGRGSLSRMSASELLEKAQKQLEEMEKAQNMPSVQSSYWTTTVTTPVVQEDPNRTTAATFPTALPTYSSHNYTQQQPLTAYAPPEHRSEHYTSPPHHSEPYSPHSDHYDGHHHHHHHHHKSRRYYSREYHNEWNRFGPESSERFHRNRRKHWIPPSHGHHRRKSWYRKHEWMGH